MSGKQQYHKFTKGKKAAGDAAAGAEKGSS
jgi:hypothetical protein